MKRNVNFEPEILRNHLLVSNQNLNTTPLQQNFGILDGQSATLNIMICFTSASHEKGRRWKLLQVNEWSKMLKLSRKNNIGLTRKHSKLMSANFPDMLF